MDLDALMLSRIQFAFTVAFHIIFPAFTIGLASFLAVLEGVWLKTKNEVYRRLYKFWVKIFAVSFAMGVVSGVVLSYQFGTNWSEFSRLAMPVIGPLLGYEVLTAFFLEASFLGIMLFGWNKVGNKLHFLSTVLVAFGTALSAFWIISANSWMQYPVGFEQTADGSLAPLDYWAIIFSPTFPPRIAHMLLAAYMTTALVVAGVCAWQLLKGRDGQGSRVGLVMAMGMIAVTAPLQVLVGHWSGSTVLEYQPAKLAAVEGLWETEASPPFHLAAWPNPDRSGNLWEVSIPGAGGWIIAGDPDRVIQGLNDWPREDRPPVAPVFWSFRVMVGLGFLMVGLGLWGAWLLWRRRPFSSRWFLRACVVMAPTGFIAVLTGWFVAEIGRQPWVVYGVIRTADAVSPVTAQQVGTSLLAYMIVYAVVFTAGALFILRMMRDGPDAAADETPPADPPRAPGWTLAAAPKDIPGDER